MTAVNISAITPHLNQILEPMLTPLTDRSAVLMQIANVKVETQQDVLRWPVSTGTSVTADAALAEGDDITTFDDDTRLKASLSFASYAKGFQVTAQALASAMVAGGFAGLTDLFEEKISETAEKLIANVAYDCLRGPGTGNRMLGMIATAGGCRATGTYAGIDRGTYTQWAANELGNGGIARAFNPTLLDNANTAVFDAAGHGDVIDFWLTGSALFDKYGESFGPNRRYVQEITLGGGRKVTLDSGFKVLEHQGVPMIRCKDMAAGEMLGGCSKYLWIKQRPDPARMITQALRTQELRGTPEPQYGDVGAKVLCSIRPLPGYTKGNTYSWGVFADPQVQVKKPSAFVRLYDLA